MNQHHPGPGLSGARWIGLLAINALGISILGISTGCRPTPSQQASPPPPPKVLVSHPVELPLAETREYTGHLAAVETVTIRARVRGVLQAIHFQEGAEVAEGTLLYELDASEYQAAVDEQVAEVARLGHEVELAESDAKRSSELYGKNAASQEDWESKQTMLLVSKTQLEKARAALKQAELNLSYTKISAPISGRIGRTLVTQGNLVGYNEPTLLTTVVKMDPVYVYYEIPERDLLRLEEFGRRESTHNLALQVPISVGLENEVGLPHPGVTDFRESQIESETGTVLMRATLQNADRKLVPGLFARIQMELGRPESRLLVPETSLAADQRGRYVLVVGANNVVEQRPVKLAANLNQEGYLVVREGVSREDRVIVSGIQKARPGMQVDPEIVTSSAIPADVDTATAPTRARTE